MIPGENFRDFFYLYFIVVSKMYIFLYLEPPINLGIRFNPIK